MRLVIDTNIIFSLFKSNSFTNKILKEYFLELSAPKNLIQKLSKYSDLICNKSNITKNKFLEHLSMLPEIIEFRDAIPLFKNKARKMISDKEDIPFLALALELGIPIWSNDSHFKKQSCVEVFTTKEIIGILKMN